MDGGVIVLVGGGVTVLVGGGVTVLVGICTVPKVGAVPLGVLLKPTCPPSILVST